MISRPPRGFLWLYIIDLNKHISLKLKALHPIRETSLKKTSLRFVYFSFSIDKDIRVLVSNGKCIAKWMVAPLVFVTWLLVVMCQQLHSHKQEKSFAHASMAWEKDVNFLIWEPSFSQCDIIQEKTLFSILFYFFGDSLAHFLEWIAMLLLSLYSI